jgi:gamma-glutamyl phosphate reductase
MNGGSATIERHERAMNMSILARDASRLLQQLTSNERKAIINRMATSLVTHSKDILQANQLDLEEANKEGLYMFDFHRDVSPFLSLSLSLS